MQNYFLKAVLTGLIAMTKLETANQAQWVFITQSANPFQTETQNKVARKTDSLINVTFKKSKFLRFIFHLSFL